MSSNHSAAYKTAVEEYNAGHWSKAMLRMLVQRSRLTVDEYAEITGDQYA